MPTQRTHRPKPGRTGNRLLDRLSDGEYGNLAPHLVSMPLKLKQLVIQQNDAFRVAYFPTTALVSSLVVMEDGCEVETGIIGAEGFVGLSIALDIETSLYREICQVPGEGYCLPAKVFRDALERSRTLDSLVRQYSAVMLRQTGQGMACNALHPVTERLSRWLLMSHDRVDRDEFPMTQEFLGDLLGVRRQTVTVAAGTLQEAGLITFRRGYIRIIDRVKLEEAACECYGVIRALYEDLFT